MVVELRLFCHSRGHAVHMQQFLISPSINEHPSSPGIERAIHHVRGKRYNPLATRFSIYSARKLKFWRVEIAHASLQACSLYWRFDYVSTGKL